VPIEIKHDSWDKKRNGQLADLRNMLWEAESLNRGSNFLEHVQKVINIAKALTSADISNGELSFISFLIEQANKASSPREGGAE
jgi:hypothetical protein